MLQRRVRHERRSSRACPLAPTCPADSVIGNNKVTVYAGGFDVPLEGIVYNLEPEEGHASEFGVALDAAPLGAPGLFAHTFIKGNVEWGKGSRSGPKHIELRDARRATTTTTSKSKSRPRLPLISSRLVFFGNENQGTKKPDDFITNGTSCPGSVHHHPEARKRRRRRRQNRSPTRRPLHLEQLRRRALRTGLLGDAGHARAGPARRLRQRSHRQPRTRRPKSTTPRSRRVTVTLPEGMTLNPSAAAGLTACTPAQARIHSSESGRRMPASSEVGTVNLEVPTLPAGLAEGQPLPRRARIGPDHRTALHDVPGRGVRASTASRCA